MIIWNNIIMFNTLYKCIHKISKNLYIIWKIKDWSEAHAWSESNIQKWLSI